MLVFDGHLHLGLEAFRWNRDLTQNAASIRRSEAAMTGKGRGTSTVSFPDMRRGLVVVCFGLITVSTDPDGEGPSSFRTAEATYAHARGELAWFGVMEQQGHLRMMRDSDAMAAHLAEWASPAETAPPLGFVLAMEGCDPILDPEQLDAWWADGLRLASLSHYGPGRYAAGTGPHGGVTPIGRELLREMERLGVILDIAHLSEQAFWETVELHHGPIAFTHGGTRALVPMWRSLSDDQLRVLIERDAVIGISMDDWQISKGWIKGQSTPDHVSLEAVVDHIDHICELAGDTNHAAIGSDLDGGFGTEQSPCDLDTIADLQKLVPLLRNRGYLDGDIAKIMHGNWVRLLNQAWSA